MVEEQFLREIDFNKLDYLEKLNIILNPDKDILSSVCNFRSANMRFTLVNHIKHNIVFIKQW
jgi:hypothetical protein